MAFLEPILEWLLQKILGYLLGKAEAAVEQKIADNKQGDIDEKNAKAYDDAKDRAARRKAALDLLNGTSAP